MMVYAYNSSMGGGRDRKFRVQGQPGLHVKFKASLGYRGPVSERHNNNSTLCLEGKKVKKGEKQGQHKILSP